MGWKAVAQADVIGEDEMLGVQVDGYDIAIIRSNGELHALHNICTHQHARLSDGFVEDGYIECPLHQGRFDIATGRAQGAPVVGELRRYPLRVEDGMVLVDLGE